MGYFVHRVSPLIRTFLPILTSHSMSQGISKENIDSTGLGNYLSLMREIGGDIAAISNHVQMVNRIYEKVNELMDATILAVSYYDESLDRLVVPCTIEKGEQIPRTELSLSQTEKLAVKCFANNQEILINNSSDLPQYDLEELNTYAGEVSASIIYIPLAIKGKPIGTITVQSFQENAYSNEHIELMRILAIYTSISIENTRTVQQVENQVKERTAELRTMNARVSVLNQIGYSLSSIRSVERINEIVYRDLSNLMKVEGFGIGLFNDLNNALEFAGYIEKGEVLQDLIQVDLGKDLLCNVSYHNRQTIHINSSEEIADYAEELPEVRHGEEAESIIYTPLIAHDTCIGVITVQSFTRNAYSITDVGLMESLSAFVAGAISNARMFEQLRLLSALGKEVTSTLNILEIADKLYTGLAGLIDTTIFILSEYDPITRDVTYMRFYERGERLGDGEGHNIDETESFAGWCIRNKAPILIATQDQFGDYLKDPLTGIGEIPQSLICLPLIYENECLGVLTVQSFESNAYTEAQMELLMSISSSLAVAMNNARIHRNIEEITSLGTEITGMDAIKDISVLLHRELQTVMPTEGFGIGFYNPLLKGLEFAYYIENGEFLDHHVDLVDTNRLSSICFNSQQTIHTGAIDDFYNYLPESYQVEHGDDTLSIIYVPLLYSDKCLGVLTVQSVKENQFSKSDVQLLESLAPYVAVAIDNIVSFNNLRSLSEIGREITAALDIEKIADELYVRLADLLDTFTFFLASYNAPKGLIDYIRVYEDGERIAEGVSYHIDDRESLATVTITEKKVIHISRAEEKANYVKQLSTPEGVPHESIIYLPIIFEGEVLGVFSVQSQKQNAYSRHHVEVMKTIASYLAVAFNNAQLHQELKVISNLGQEITSQTDPINVLYVAYDRLSEILDLDGFGIGVHNPVTGTIDFPGFIEAGKVLGAGSHSLEKKLPSTLCFKLEETIHIDTVDQLVPYLENKDVKAVDGEICRSIVYVPVNLGDERLGVATMQSFKEFAFSEKNVELFKNLCSYIAVAIDNSKAYSNLTTLSEIGKTITSTFNMKLIADTLNESLSALMEVGGFILGTYDARTNNAQIIRLYKHGKITAEDESFTMGETNPVANLVVSTKQSIIIGSREELLEYLPDHEQNPQNGEVAESMIYLPVIFDDEALGFVSVQNTRKNVFNERHLEVLKNISAYLAVSFNNARSYSTINKLAEIGQEITSRLDLEFIFESVYNNLRSLMFVEFLVIAEHDVEKGVIRNRYRIENGQPEHLGLEVDVNNDNHPGAWCVRNKKMIHVSDLPNEYHAFSKDLGGTIGDLLMSVIYKPLMSGDEVVGLISIQSFEKHAYNNYHVQILDLIAPYVTSALQNGLTYEKLEQAHVELEKLSIVASETDNAIIIAAPDGTYEWVNKAGCEMTGKSLEELANGVNTIQSLSTFDGIEAAIKEVKETRQSVIYESQVISDTGKIWAQTTLTPILNNKGELAKLVAIDSDITEMKRVQRALKRSEEDYKRLFERISDSIFITKKATRKFMDCNHAVQEIYGYTKEEILTMSAVDLHPEDELITSDDCRVAIDMTIEEFHHVKKNGEKIIVDVSSVDIYYRGHDATLSIIRDITDTKRFEQKILEQNAELEKLSIVASSTDNVVIICAPNGDLLWANDSYERVFGKSIQERAKETGGNLFKGSGNNEIKNYIDQCLETKQGISYESKHVNAKGETVWLQSTLTPVFDENEGLKNFVIIDSDITKQKLNELLVIEKNKDITDSINYASRLQQAILPDQSDFNRMMEGAFVYFEPRDIVSGDFYWMTRTSQNELIVAAIDCTGHGVPGAFLTITGNDLLNQIVKLKGITKPTQILDQMNSGLLRRLHTTTDKEIKDGMDMSVCKISKGENGYKVDYAGAFNPLYYVINKEIHEVKGNRFAIGTPLSEEQQFEGEQLHLPENTMLYLFSDGYHDQLGGKKGKKFMKSKFRQLLVEISDLEVDEQRDKLKSNFDEWSGDMAQVDDVLVMGIRL